jgi:hypothetical protein
LAGRILLKKWRRQMRAPKTTTLGLVLAIGAVAVAGEAPRSAEARMQAESDFASLRKSVSVVYSDRANHRLPARIKPGAWRKAGRRLGLRVEADGRLELRLRRSRVQKGERVAFLVRWTELVPAGELDADEKAYYRGRKRSGRMHHIVPRALVLEAPWNPAARDDRTGDCVCVVSCGKLPYEVRGRQLKVQVVSYVAKPDPKRPPAPGRDPIRPPARPSPAPRPSVR